MYSNNDLHTKYLKICSRKTGKVSLTLKIPEQITGLNQFVIYIHAQTYTLKSTFMFEEIYILKTTCQVILIVSWTKIKIIP